MHLGRPVPSSCSMAGRTAEKPSHCVGLRPSLSQNDGESSFGGGTWYNSCALRKKYIARGFWTMHISHSVKQQTQLWEPTHDPSLLQLLCSNQVPERRAPPRTLGFAEEGGMRVQDRGGGLFCLDNPISILVILPQDGCGKRTLEAALTSHLSPSKVGLKKSGRLMPNSHRTAYTSALYWAFAGASNGTPCRGCGPLNVDSAWSACRASAGEGAESNGRISC